MFFKFIEQQIKEEYKHYLSTKKEDYVLNLKKRNQIISNSNYKLNELFVFLNDLKLTLYIQNIKVESLKDLAKILREERKARCITKLQLLTEYGLNFNLINKIETGKNIEKETLKKYLVFLPPLKISIQRN